MSDRMSREDRRALLNSEVYQELEMAERQKLADNKLQDEIVKSPATQQAIQQVAPKAISDGITKALSGMADDEEFDHGELKDHMKKLDDHELFEVYKLFVDELDTRDIDPEKYEEEYEEKEEEETEEDEEKEDDDIDEVLAYVKASLNHIADSAADSGNTEAAYLIERFVQKIS